MLKKATPSRRRRTCGHIIVALTCLVVGYGVWAAEPDATRSAAPSASASPTNELRGSRLTIMLNPGANITVDADQINYDSDHEMTIFEGHVHMKASARLGHGMPSEKVMPTELGNVLIEGDTVLITKQADGRHKVEIENGSIRTL